MSFSLWARKQRKPPPTCALYRRIVEWLYYNRTSMRVGSSAARRGWEKMNTVGCAVQVMMRLVGFPSWPAPGAKA